MLIYVLENKLTLPPVSSDFYFLKLQLKISRY